MIDTLKKFLKKLGLREPIKKIQKSFNFVRDIRINDKKLKTLQLYGAICEVNEPWMLTVLNHTLKIKSKGFFDVGVNLGQTLMEIKSLAPDISYIGFEPNASCVMYVEELVRINKFSNVTLVPAGLYIEDTVLNLDLYYDDITNSGGSIIQDYWTFTQRHPVHRKLIVPVFTYKTIAASIPNINFDILKIDVEGAEMEVLETLYEEIIANKPVIIIEILSAYSEENELRVVRQNKVLQIVKNLNYEMLIVIEDGRGHLKQVKPIYEFDVKADPNQCNYIFYAKQDKEVVHKTFQNYIKMI
jgi:FkbM family methyltransferase